MLKKLLSVLVVAALVCALGGTTGLAETKPEAKAGEAAKEMLRADISKLVAEARAGSKTVLLPRAQIQTSKGNSLSKGTKIAIGVAIAAAVVVIVAVAVNKRCDNEPGGC